MKSTGIGFLQGAESEGATIRIHPLRGWFCTKGKKANGKDAKAGK
jgi:hypothetical protein